jgi:hypothetical protein
VPSPEKLDEVASGFLWPARRGDEAWRGHGEEPQRRQTPEDAANSQACLGKGTLSMIDAIDARGVLPVFGWRERVALPQLGIDRIKAKLDTGARSSALHVESVEPFLRDDVQWLRFEVLTGRRARHPFVCEAAALDRRRVRDSGGHVSERWFIETDVALGPLRLGIEISLTDRCGMLFPMLLGRTALAGRMLVDPARSYTLAHPTPARPPRR